MNTVTAAEDSGREFDLSDRDFARVCKMIYARAGISLNETKRNMVYSRLSKRVRERDLPGFGEYLDLLEEESDTSAEWQNFTNALTTNLTSFFRESHHFEMLAEHLRARRDKPVALWSSASSTGEEAYSMAMTAVDTLRTRTPQVRILATDIDTLVLESGRRGVYRDDNIAKLDPELARRHFQRGTGANAGHARVKKELRDMVSFRQLNLLQPAWPLREKFTAIFCRNVLIYFDKPTQRGVVERIAARLEPDGLLCIGHSENLMWARDLFESCGRTAYRLARAAGGG
jgi:chemotaxis protein methyltransferase CheR